MMVMLCWFSDTSKKRMLHFVARPRKTRTPDACLWKPEALVFFFLIDDRGPPAPFIFNAPAHQHRDTQTYQVKFSRCCGVRRPPWQYIATIAIYCYCNYCMGIAGPPRIRNSACNSACNIALLLRRAINIARLRLLHSLVSEPSNIVLQTIALSTIA